MAAGFALSCFGSGVSNGLGSVRGMTDSLGAVVVAYRTDEYGVSYETRGKAA